VRPPILGCSEQEPFVKHFFVDVTADAASTLEP
jgi:hypothetical protein